MASGEQSSADLASLNIGSPDKIRRVARRAGRREIIAVEQLMADHDAAELERRAVDLTRLAAALPPDKAAEFLQHPMAPVASVAVCELDPPWELGKRNPIWQLLGIYSEDLDILRFACGQRLSETTAGEESSKLRHVPRKRETGVAPFVE